MHFLLTKLTITGHRYLCWWRSQGILLATVTIFSIGAAPLALAAPIATNTALPLSNHEFIFREQLALIQASDRLVGTRRELTQYVSRSVLGYGVTPKWAVFGVLPVVKVQRVFGASRSTETGIGDAALFTRYEIYQADKPGRTFRVSPYFGVRLPTGREGKTGDGSTDIFGGLIATVATTQWVLDSQFRYDFNREADGFERGNVARLESSFQYRLSPKSITLDTKGFLFGVIELGAAHFDNNRIMGTTDRSSGGFQLSVTPGVQYSTQRWIVDLGVRIPVISNLKGNALDQDYELLTSVRINF
jgi:hypothetical protein